jgi:hypothetical protein
MKQNSALGIFGLALALLLLARGTLANGSLLVGNLRLLVAGQEADATVLDTQARFIDVLPYRVEYRFDLEGESFEEPIHNGWRSYDIGAPLTRAMWQQAGETGTVSIVFLQDSPEINMPAPRQPWTAIFLAYQLGRVIVPAGFAIIVVVALIFKGRRGAFLGGEGARLAVATVAVAMVAWLGLQFILRLYYFAYGTRDMSALDLLVSALTVFASGVVPLGLLVAVSQKIIFDD